MDNKNKNHVKTLISYIAVLLITLLIAYVFTRILPKNSFGADSQTINLQANIKKYINYKISDQEKGTLLQYDVKAGIDYNEDEEQYIPVKQSQIKLEMNQIDNKYPYSVKVIARSTEATNGKQHDISELYRYNNETGILIIQASNLDENNQLINNKKINNANDEYTVICNYDTYIEETAQREIDIKAEAIVLLSEDNRIISKQEEFKGTVQNNIGELTSVEYVNSDIYNGYIKSNIINETNYDTEYKETQKIFVSKKEAQDEIWIIEKNGFINTENNQIETDLGNNGELLYKNTKLYKSNLLRVLGEEGTLEILDSEKNLIATIDKNTEYDEDGTKTINYQDNIESIIIKTSKIQNEGILELENTKVIKNTMRKTQNVKINTTTHLFGVKNVLKNNETIKEQLYRNEKENTIEIKDSTTDVKFDINKTEWTNKEQNELVFDISLNTSSIKNNLFKNPSIKIELPKEVEKVIIGDSHIVYGNGLELRDVHVENDENGMFNIIASIEGSQTTFNENTLGLNTNIKIPATVILKKDIQSEKENIKLLCTNDFTLDDNKEVINKNVEIEITSYQQEDVNNGEVTNQEAITTMLRQSAPSETIQNQEKIEGLDLEVVPVKGDTVLKDGDTVYEGEFIKYNIKVTNTSDRQIDNIKIVGSIPEGTTYGELEADYHNVWGQETGEGEYKTGKYEYNYDDSVKEKIIEIETLEPGKSIENFYEVNVNDLDNEEEKQTNTTIKAYSKNTEMVNYSINNIIKPSEIKLFIDSYIDGSGKKGWTYRVHLISEKEQTVNLKVKLPKEFNVIDIITVTDNQDIIKKKNISNDNIADMTVAVSQKNVELSNSNDAQELNEEEFKDGAGPDVGPGNIIYITGKFDDLKIENKTKISEMELTAVASVMLNDVEYNSNENRIVYGYENVLIEMTSENEGEEAKYNDEINYEIKIKNIGKSNLGSYSTNVKLTDYLPDNLNPIRLTYESWNEELEEVQSEENIYKSTGIFTKTTVEKDLSIKELNSDGEEIIPVDLEITIPYGETAIINIETSAGAVFEKTKIENMATISVDGIGTKTSNTISHIILPHDYIYNHGENESEDSDNLNNPTDSGENKNSENTNGNYSISGVAWLDINQDGQRQISEELLSGINVMLVDANNATNIQEKKSTNSNGEYSFSNLDKGSYIVVFDYDTNKYSLTDYQKEGVNSALNSDAMSKEITISGSKTKVGLTDSILLDASVKNIDVGLIKNKICDLKLDKYISKVTVNTASGVKEQSYERSQLAKVEIKSKEIQGATVLVEYKIVVTNEGEIPTSANKIIDYIPDGLQFSSELNKDWILSKAGELNNTSFSNTKIESGKSIELTLILTKSMTANSTGTFTNSAEIGEINNVLKINDTDSIAANKVETEDDYSKADLIISVSTGAFMYISIILGIIVILGIILYINAKFGFKKISKIFMIATILIPTIFIIVSNNSIAAGSTSYLPEEAWFRNPKVTSGSSDFEGYYYSGNKKINLNGTCGLSGGWATQEYYTKYIKLFENVSKKEIADSTKTTGTLSISQNTSTKFTMKQEDNYFILGPFTINRSNASSYSYSVKTNKGTTIGNLSPYNKTNANSNGGFTFYLKIPTSKVAQGDFIKWVYLKADKTGVTTEKEYNITAEAHYKPTTEHTNGTWGGTTEYTYRGNQYRGWLYDGQIYQPVILTTEKKDTITTNSTDSKTLTWEYEYANLQLEKQDKNDSNLKLSGVQFKITGPSYPNGTTLTTGSNGKIEELTNIIPGEYSIEEIYNPYYGYTEYINEKRNINPGINVIKLNNAKKTGNLVIEKKDRKTDANIEGIGFKLKRVNGDQYDGYVEILNNNQRVPKVTGQIHVDENNIKYVSDENLATEFITDKYGKIELNNILNGWYEVEETSIGEYYQYDLDDNYISWAYWSKGNEESENGRASNASSKKAKIRVFTRDSRNTTANPAEDGRDDVLKFTNTPTNIKISGYAFEDSIDGKASSRNNLYDNEQDDKRLANIRVCLYNKNGELIDTKKTDKNGEYLFGDYKNGDEKIKIDDLEDAYITFEYNGMSYEPTDIVDENGDKVKNGALQAADNSNKVVENQTKPVNEGINKTREEFNSKYAIIENNKSNAYDLRYRYQDHTSELIYGDNPEYGYEGQKYPTSGIDNQYIMTANTADKGAKYNLKNEVDNVLKDGKDTLENINLGLRQREMPDIAIYSDVQEVEANIKGYKHTYQYGQREKNKGTYTDEGNEDDVFDVTVKVGNKYGNESYSRQLYESDCKYRGDNELEIYVTYKVELYNESTNLTTQINSIVDYYDKKYYELYSIEDIQEDAKEPNTYNSYIINEDYSEDYGQISINNMGITLEKQTKKSICIKFKLINYKNIAYYDTINTKQFDLNNVSEINSYSVYDGNEVYAGIDKDSNPGSIEPGNMTTYEDDTDKAPTLKIAFDKERKITGTVFLDEATEGTSGGTGNERKGNGIFDENNEATVDNVSVELYNVDDIEVDEDSNTVKIKDEANPVTDETIKYTYSGENKEKTSSDGKYTISGFTPGEYRIVYKWTDGNYYINNDKKGNYNTTDYKGTIWTRENRTEKEQSGNKWYKTNVETRYSDAMDDWETRKKIDAGEDIKEMNSTTPEMNIEIEITSTTTTSFDDKFIPEGYSVTNIDFGIVERARQQLDINKRVKSFKVTLANGQTIVDANVIYDEDTDQYKLKENTKYVTYMGPSEGNSRGLLKVEIDNELIQGAKAQIGYEIIVKNNSEKDYDSEEYYKFGEETGNVITIKPEKVYDYLDGTVLDSEKQAENGNWKVVSKEEYNNKYVSPTIVEKYFLDTIEKQAENGNDIDVYKWEVATKTYQEIYTEWYSEITETRKVRDVKLDKKTILNNADLEKELEPGKQNDVMLYTSVTLANSNEIDLNNDVEITELRKIQQSGRDVTPLTSTLIERGQSVTVIPPTGENNNIVLIIATTVSALVLLGVGVFIIKRNY